MEQHNFKRLVGLVDKERLEELNMYSLAEQTQQGATVGGRGGHGSNLKISIGWKGSKGRIIWHENLEIDMRKNALLSGNWTNC